MQRLASAAAGDATKAHVLHRNTPPAAAVSKNWVREVIVAFCVAESHFAVCNQRYFYKNNPEVFSERDTYVHVRYMLSAVRLSSVCRLSVCRL